MCGRAHQRPLKRQDVERIGESFSTTTERGHNASTAATMATASSVEGEGEIDLKVECSKESSSDMMSAGQLTKAYFRACVAGVLLAWYATF